MKAKLKDLQTVGLAREEDKKYTISFFVDRPHHHFGGEEPDEGEPCTALKTAEGWSSQKGYKDKMKKGKLERFIKDSVPAGEMADLARACTKSTEEFHDARPGRDGIARTVTDAGCDQSQPDHGIAIGRDALGMTGLAGGELKLA